MSCELLLLDFCNCRRGSPYGCLICFIVSLPIVVIFTLSLSLTFGTEPHQISSTETYALSDNRIIAYKGDFCQGLRTSSTSVPLNQQSMGYLYFLKSSPPLTERETFTTSVTASLDSNMEFRYWNFYLNAGSVASFTVCYQQAVRNRGVIFYIIRGTKQLNEWIEEPAGNVEKSYPLASDCDTIDYQVRGDSMYYFVFYLSDGSFSALYVEFSIDRILYNIQPDNILHECSFALDGTSSCVLSVGMNSGYTAVLSLNASRPIDYADDGAEIHIGCQARVWLYAVIVVVVFIVCTLIFICGIVVCVELVKSPSSSSRSRATNTVVVADTTTELSFTKPSSTDTVDYPQQPPPEYPPPPPYSAT